MARKVKIEEITKLATKVLKKYDLDDNDVDAIINHLLDEELMGKPSHGFYRLAGIIKHLKNKEVNKNDIKVDKETITSASVNGGCHIGLVVAEYATKVAIDKAKEIGFCMVGANNYFGTTGAMGYYTRKIADNDLIGVVICNSRGAVAPWGGKDAILGTNPISIGIPTKNEPIIVDLATSACSYGNLMLAAKENRTIPKGLVLDEKGNPSNNPNDANEGCQLPMGEHKGYALGLAIELLAGPFIGAKAGEKAVQSSDGFLVCAISSEQFVSLSQFKENTSSLIEEIKNSSLAPGYSEIRIPGEESFKNYNRNKQNGIIEMSDTVFKEIEELSR